MREHPYAARMTALAESFPALADKPGVRPWKPLALAKWSEVASHGEGCAARFVLGVWSHGTFPGVAKFDFFEAMDVWDEEQITAFVAWCKEPFWP